MNYEGIEPNLFIIGAPKCGTTAVYHALNSIPEIEMSRVKETGFFANEALYPLGLAYYARSYFSGSTDALHRGEVSPWYLYQRETIRRMQSCLRRPLTVVVLVRNPTDRAVSMYFDQRGGGYETRPPEIALDPRAEPQRRLEMRYVDHGHFSRYLGDWSTAFGDRLHVLPAPSWNTIPDLQRAFSDALGIDISQRFLHDLTDSQRNLSGQSPHSALIRNIKFLGRSRQLKLAVRRTLPPGFDQRLLTALRQRGRVYGRTHDVTVSSDVLERLDSHYESEVAIIKRDWGIDLSPHRTEV